MKETTKTAQAHFVFILLYMLGMCRNKVAHQENNGAVHPPIRNVQYIWGINFLGVPFNIASYAILTHMLAQQADLEVGEFVHTFGDCHLYSNHLTDEIVYEQLRREPRSLPELRINRKPGSLFDYQYEDFEVIGYDPHPHIKAPVAV